MDFLDWVGDIFSPVVDWVFGEGGAAIASAAVKGAITGIVVGAASAIIRGDDILKGALKGAAYGGITGGIVGGIGYMTDVKNTAGIENIESTTKLPEETITSGLTRTPSYDSNTIRNAGSGKVISPEFSETISKTPIEKPWYKTDAATKIIAGVGQGVASGAGEYLAAEKKAESDKALLSERERIDQAKITANQPGGILKAQTANIQMQSWWDKHLNSKTGLLASEVA